MPETLRSGTGRPGKFRPEEWLPVIDPDQPGMYGPENAECLYCGHPMSEHQTQAIMKTPKGRTRRVRTGLRWATCLKCAKQMQTNQVTCYMAPGVSDDPTLNH